MMHGDKGGREREMGGWDRDGWGREKLRGRERERER